MEMSCTKHIIGTVLSHSLYSYTTQDDILYTLIGKCYFRVMMSKGCCGMHYTSVVESLDAGSEEEISTV